MALGIVGGIFLLTFIVYSAASSAQLPETSESEKISTLRGQKTITVTCVFNKDDLRVPEDKVDSMETYMVVKAHFTASDIEPQTVAGISAGGSPWFGGSISKRYADREIYGTLPIISIKNGEALKGFLTFTIRVPNFQADDYSKNVTMYEFVFGQQRISKPLIQRFLKRNESLFYDGSIESDPPGLTLKETEYFSFVCDSSENGNQLCNQTLPMRLTRACLNCPSYYKPAISLPQRVEVSCEKGTSLCVLNNGSYSDKSTCRCLCNPTVYIEQAGYKVEFIIAAVFCVLLVLYVCYLKGLLSSCLFHCTLFTVLKRFFDFQGNRYGDITASRGDITSLAKAEDGNSNDRVDGSFEEPEGGVESDRMELRSHSDLGRVSQPQNSNAKAHRGAQRFRDKQVPDGVMGNSSC